MPQPFGYRDGSPVADVVRINERLYLQMITSNERGGTERNKNAGPLISIIIPTYNVEKYIGRCMDSIIGQTYRNLEIIPVNDGSTDCCGKILDRYARQDERIRVIHQANLGRIAVRKTGVLNACGDFLLFVDGDDWVEPQTVEVLLRRATEAGADVTVGLHQNVYDNGSTQQTGYVSTDWCYDRDRYIRQMMKGRISGSMCTKLFKRGVLTEDMFDFPREYSAAEDLVMNCSSFKNIMLAAGVGQVLYNYYQRNESLCHTFVPRISYYRTLWQIALRNMGSELSSRYILHCQGSALIIYLDILYSELYRRNRTYAGTDEFTHVQQLARNRKIRALLPLKHRIKAHLILHPWLLHSSAHLWQLIRHGRNWQSYTQIEHP